jgi:DnaK suppressor protein
VTAEIREVDGLPVVIGHFEIGCGVAGGQHGPMLARRRPATIEGMGAGPDLRRFVERLHALRDEIVNAGDEHVAEEIDPARKVDEDAAPHDEMSRVIASNRNRARTEELREIEAALRRIADDPDDFGICETCSEPIPAKRLELVPWVRLCIECQQAQEDDRPVGRKHITDFR